MPSLRSLLSALLLTVLLTGPARADGKFIPPDRLKPVEIPTQSAAISFSDGKEVLTIWNTIQTSAGETAWVLPLPAKPDAIQKTSPEAFRLLEMLCAPEVQASGDGLSTGQSWALGIFCLGWGLIFLRLRRAPADLPDELKFLRWMGLGLCMIVSLLVLFYGLVEFGMYGFKSAAAGGPVAGVQELDVQSVGAYETTVLSATGSGPLNEWLKTGGFPEFTGPELAVVDDYAARGWVFLCARMHMDQGKPRHAPHPLTVRFPTDKVIYPMQLTAGSGPAVEVRLFVIGAEALRDPSGRLAAFVDAPLWRQFETRTRRGDLWTSEHAQDYETFRDTAPNEYDRKKGVPPDMLFDSLWEAYLINRDSRLALLKGTFRQDSDWSDIRLQPSDEKPRQPKLATRSALTAERVSLATLLAAPLFLVLAFRARMVTPMNGCRPAWRTVLKITAMSAGLFLVIRLLPWNMIGVEVAETAQLHHGQDTTRDTKSAVDAWIRDIINR